VRLSDHPQIAAALLAACRTGKHKLPSRKRNVTAAVTIVPTAHSTARQRRALTRLILQVTRPARRQTRRSVPANQAVYRASFMTQVPSPSPALPARSAWAAFIAGFGYAFSGLWHMLRTQRNATVHAVVAALAIMAGLFLGISAVEFALTFVAIGGVFITEMFNTALEACVDLASPQLHPLAKIAKDVAAGAVLVSAMLAVIIGLCIFGPHLWDLLIR
jgi:diacylglycerol kinase